MGFLFRKKRDLPEYFFKRGEECLKEGNLRWALESLNKAIELNTEHEMAYLRRAETLGRLGRKREAVWDLVKFVEYDRRGPDNPGDLDDVIREGLKIARMDMQRKDARGEIVSYGIPKLLDEMMEGYDPEAHYGDKRFYDFAMAWLKEEPHRDYRYSGFVKLVKNDLDGAMVDLRASVERHPEDPYPCYLIGVALLKTGRGRRPLMGRAGSPEGLSDKAYDFFEQALSRGLEGRICPGCGHRASSDVSFCLRCGSQLMR